MLRIRPSGKHSYLVLLGRGKWYTLGRADVLKPEEPREQAQSVLGDVAKGKDPIVEKRKQRAATLEDFVREHYEPWVVSHRKSGQQTVDRLRARFKDIFGATRLHEITPFADVWRVSWNRNADTPAAVERWRCSGVQWVRTYQQGERYPAGALCTRRGGLWWACRETHQAPGMDPHDWKLICKEGEAHDR